MGWVRMFGDVFPAPLNESPSEKEGKSSVTGLPSSPLTTLNESPSEKEGKFCPGLSAGFQCVALNESPSEKEGK